MKLKPLWLALPAFVLAACRSNSDPVATSVAATLAAMPSPTSAVPVVEATATTAPDESSPTPVTPAASSTPGPTDTPVPTETLQPTATLSSDPKAGLGDPIFSEPFDVPSGWAIWSDEIASGQLADGRYTLSVFQSDTYRYSLRSVPGGDLYEEITASVGECHANDAYGLLFRVQADSKRGYYFAVSCDGRYQLFKHLNDEGPPVPLVDWTGDPAIVKGPNATNVLGVMGRGNQLALYANGHLLAALNDETFPGGQFTGLYVSADTAPVSVSFDDLTLWSLE